MSSAFDEMVAGYTESQKNAMAVLMSGENVFLTGGAGTGKSFLIREFIKNNRDKKILLSAPTGIAAENIQGHTLHKIFKFSPSPISRNFFKKPETEFDLSMLKDTDILIIDEISMCRADLFGGVSRMLHMASDRYEKSYQLIVVGDFYQLPPVIKAEDRRLLENDYGDRIAQDEHLFVFNSKLWAEYNFKNIVLKEVVRQRDKDYIEALNRVRIGDFGALAWIYNHSAKEYIPDGIVLYGKNVDVDSENIRKLREVQGELLTFEAECEGVCAKGYGIPKLAQKSLELKVGARIMMLTNDPSGRFNNGSLGYIEFLSDSDNKGVPKIIVELDNGNKVSVEKYKWTYEELREVKKTLSEIKDEQTRFPNRVVNDTRMEWVETGKFIQYPLKLAYAITIHKSQGQTFDKVNIHPDAFTEGQLYVAISRCSHKEQLHFLEVPEKSSLLVAEEVSSFYKKIEPLANETMKNAMQMFEEAEKQRQREEEERRAAEAKRREAEEKQRQREEEERRAAEAKRREAEEKRKEQERIKKNWFTFPGTRIIHKGFGEGVIVKVTRSRWNYDYDIDVEYFSDDRKHKYRYHEDAFIGGFISHKD